MDGEIIGFAELARIQQLAIDISRVSRNHKVPGTEEHENVVEHCFATAMLCWRVQQAYGLDLDMSKVFKYVMVHDLLERGLERDFVAYRSQAERDAKRSYEDIQREALIGEFSDFNDLLFALADYEQQVDPEAQFVWTVEKMQALLLDQMDDWRAHRTIGATYDDFCDHHDRLVEICYPPLQELFAEVVECGRQNYYDQP